MKKSFFLTAVFTLFIFIVVNAQTKNEFQISIVNPSGDFADDDTEDFLMNGSGCAGTGFSIGYKLISPINVKDLFFTFSASLLYNDINTDLKEDLEDDFDNFDKYSLPKFLNIPFMAGLQYEKALSNKISIFGEVGLGLNLLKITDLYAEEENNSLRMIYEPSIKLGYEISGGVLINNKYTIGLCYNILGSHKVKFKTKYEEDNDRDSEDGRFDKALDVEALSLKVGIRF